MSIVSLFTNTLKKAMKARETEVKEHARSDGLLGPTNQDAAGSFTPLRPAPTPDDQFGPEALDLKIAAEPDSVTTPVVGEQTKDGDILVKIGDVIREDDPQPEVRSSPAVDSATAAEPEPSLTEPAPELTETTTVYKVESPFGQKLEFPTDHKIEGGSDLKDEWPLDLKLKDALEQKLGLPVDQKLEVPFDHKVELPPEIGETAGVSGPIIDIRGGVDSGSGFPTKASDGPTSFVSSDPEEGGEINRYSADPEEGGEFTRASADPEEGGEFTGGRLPLRDFGGDPFKIEIEDLAAIPESPSSPPGVPVPYPNISAAAADGDESGLTELARKAGEGQKDYLVVKLNEVIVTRDTSGELPGDDDDLPDSTILDLKPEATVAELRPGLAGFGGDELGLKLGLEIDDDIDDDIDDGV